MFKRIRDATVWAHAGVPADAWRFRGIFRFVLPLTDLLFLWFGIVGWVNGVGTVQHAAGTHWQMWWSLSVALAAAVAFVGISFPKLWAFELVAKIVLIGLVSGYLAIFLTRGFTDPRVTAVAGLEAILILLPVWRVGDLGFVAWQRGHGGRK